MFDGQRSTGRRRAGPARVDQDRAVRNALIPGRIYGKDRIRRAVGGCGDNGRGSDRRARKGGGESSSETS